MHKGKAGREKFLNFLLEGWPGIDLKLKDCFNLLEKVILFYT